jgi:hypothetical protein
VDDQPEIQPAATWENPNSPQPAVVRIDGAEIPGDGLTHRVTVSAWQQVGTTTSPKATLSEYLAPRTCAPGRSPEVVRGDPQAPGHGPAISQHRQLPDLVEVKWRHPGAVALFAKFLKSGKTAIVQIGVADHQEAVYMAEGVSALMGYTANPIDVYLGVAAIARGHLWGRLPGRPHPDQDQGL